MDFKYFAFISYNSKDTAWGKRLQRKLEHYKMPSTLCSEHGWQRRPIKPVFFAPTDIQPGGLSEELQGRLQASRNLIVICSPHSAQSEWVGKEIEYFHQLGRTKQIHFFIIDGEPHSNNPETECFNPIVDTLGLPEILAANIHERIYRWPWMNKERAYVQLISKLLGVEFDAIWQRHKRLLIRTVIAWMVGLLTIAASMTALWYVNQPVDVNISLDEATVHNKNLPSLKDAVVTMELDNETKMDTIRSLQESAVFRNIPHNKLNKQVRIQAVCKDFVPLDTVLFLTKDVELRISRDPKVYGDIHFRIYDFNQGRNVSNVDIEIEGVKTKSDAGGMVRLFVPLDKQKQRYHIKSSIPLTDDSIFMPHSEDAVILIK